MARKALTVTKSLAMQKDVPAERKALREMTRKYERTSLLMTFQ